MASLSDFEKSDIMICNNVLERRCMNDTAQYRAFLQQLGKTQPVTLRDVDRETGFLQGQSTRTFCNEATNTRGGNAVPCKDSACIGYKCYTPYHMHDWLLTPCVDNTFRNHIECDDDKCCSIRHQMFMNITKRK